MLTIASSDCVRFGFSDECFAISNYRENIDQFKESRQYNVEYLTVNNEKSQINLDFRNVVANGNYIYFLFVLNHTVSKLGKICTDVYTFYPQFNTYEDVPIFCTHNGVIFTKAQDLMFWNDDLLVVFTDGTASVICRLTNLFDNFKISRIDRLKCPYRQLKNKYLRARNVDVCYNETIEKCQSAQSAGIVSID
jgi:disulfide oxidoreductase YuzD